jgi:hypothetical protein
MNEQLFGCAVRAGVFIAGKFFVGQELPWNSLNVERVCLGAVVLVDSLRTQRGSRLREGIGGYSVEKNAEGAASGPGAGALPAPKKRSVTAGIIVAFVVAWVLWIFFPGERTLIWHLRHGNSIQYNGKTVPVPPRWTAFLGNGVLFSKRPLTILFQHKLQGRMSVGDPAGRGPSGTREQLTKLWVALFQSLHSRSDEVVSGPQTIGSGPQEAICVEASSHGVAGRTTAACFVIDSKWTFQFEGDTKDLDSFFDVVKGTK